MGRSRADPTAHDGVVLETTTKTAAADGARRGIQSVEAGGRLLQALVRIGRPMALKDLAREAGMASAQAHPYLVSFGRLGLVEQQPATGVYALGPLALQLGLIGLQQTTPVQLATPLLAPLARQVGQTVALAVWGVEGPTIVRVEESPAVIFASMRHGTVFSLASTATGRAFGAWLDVDRARAALDAERQRRVGPQQQRQPQQRPGRRGDPPAAPAPAPGMPRRLPVPAWSTFQRQLAEVRRHRIARSEGEVVDGVHAMSAPVFDASGAMVLAITAIGPAATLLSQSC